MMETETSPETLVAAIVVTGMIAKEELIITIICLNDINADNGEERGHAAP
jgi:hypothetical protein